MDQYVSWNLPPSELTIDIIWGKYKEYCKLQSNDIRARFDLLNSSSRVTVVWMSGIMWYRHK